MIASCNEGEGTSTIAVNLSTVFAQNTDEKVLLIDANLRNPMLEKIFNVEKSPGLTDVLSEKVELGSSFQKTEMENLKVLTAGNKVLNPVSVLNSKKISNCIEKLKRYFSIILIDSAPIIPFSDSLYLASKVDVFLLVIEAEKTRWEVAREAIKKMSLSEINVFGTILNKKKDHIPASIYKML